MCGQLEITVGKDKLQMENIKRNLSKKSQASTGSIAPNSRTPEFHSECEGSLSQSEKPSLKRKQKERKKKTQWISKKKNKKSVRLREVIRTNKIRIQGLFPDVQMSYKSSNQDIQY